MIVLRLLTARLRFALAVLLINYPILLAFRAVFALMFAGTGGEHSTSNVLEALYLGAKFDLRLSLLILLPILLLSWLPGINIVRWRPARYLWLAYLVLANLGYTTFYMFDFGHYAYLGTRLNASVLRLLAQPDIAFEVAWESYPIVPTVLGMLVFAGAIAWVQWRLAFPLLDWSGWPHPRWRRVVLGVAAFFLVVFGVYGKLSWYPLRWSEAFFVADPYVNALALNPVLYFFDTYGNQSLGFDEKAVGEHYDEVAAYLGVDHPNRDTLNFERTVRPKGVVERPYNVVLIHLESFASRYTGIFGNGTDPTPHFDAIARAGVFFPNYYVPSPGTARSVFAAFTGLPDVMSQGSTSTRNPQLVEQHVIVSEFPGYHPFYFLGGSASWGNIRGLLARNIPGIQIYEEGSYASPRADGWGISDLDLFIEANQVLRKAGNEPFFAMIQTAGNHRPYTIPEKYGTFEPVQLDEATWKRWGFTSLDELNALRFIDYSLGHFFEIARKEPYFERTIFLMYGDHGIPGGGAHVTPAQAKLNLPAYHVPFVIYAPKLFPQGKVDARMASEVDMLPTVAGLLGIPYRYTGMGRDLFDPRFDVPRYAFTVLMDYPPVIGLLDERYYLRMDEARGAHLYDYRSADPAVPDLMQREPERAAAMERIATGLWHTARYLLHHNKEKPPAGG